MLTIFDSNDVFIVSARINKRHSVLHHTSNVVSALAMEHEIKVNSMSAGETLGEAILSEDGIRKASCVTEEPTEMIFLNRKHFDSTFHLFLDKIRKEKIEFLSTFDFLSSWDTKILDTLAQICREKTYHSGDVIIKQVRKEGLMQQYMSESSQDLHSHHYAFLFNLCVCTGHIR